MKDVILSRRNVLAGSSALVALGSGLSVSFAADTPISSGGIASPAAAQSTNQILVVIFCRFGQDGMQLVAPAGDPDYIKNRPTIAVSASTGLGLGTLNGVDMYMNASMPEIKALYDAKQMAPVVAVGVPTVIRSHFQAQDMMERGGADGMVNPNNGWLARHIASTGGEKTTLATVAAQTNTPTSLAGDNQALAIASPATFQVNGGTATSNVTRTMFRGSTAYELKALETIDAIANVQTAYKNLSSTNQNGFGYTNGDLSTSLKNLATLIKMNVGISVATIDMGGWDHHQNLTPAFTSRATELSKAIAAFWKDIAAYQPQTTIVTMTEFGRRFQENANRGLDHGSASTMMVVSSKINGGKVYGQWPGLASNQLFGGDLAVTTDYRTVLSEIMVTQHSEQKIATVFPTVPYYPIGLFASPTAASASPAIAADPTVAPAVDQPAPAMDMGSA
jgi:uncharacterized protein (DUF1501 family)